MKIIENNPDQVWFSNGGKTWEKLFVWILGLITTFYFFTGGDFIAYLMGFIIGLFFFSLPFFISEVFIDIKSDKVYRRLKIFSIILNKMEAQLSTSTLLVGFESRTHGLVPHLYLVPPSCKKYRIGVFYSIKTPEIFLKEITKYAPINTEIYP